ncbi:hypothetical protein TanjilG_24224 [Lupinus angustifolius]|uniref:Uncharacterized protein n=1 Tax=Lupinus angustifolius TaxID=3871 RepID=A0A1J7FMR7_LUPAN|nr:hypothetical protein TanjilG_24224 [Lupinus angustifolius]
MEAKIVDPVTGEALSPGQKVEVRLRGPTIMKDRLKELIKCKAYQVPPVELEHLLHTNPEIDDIAVVLFQWPLFVVRKLGSNIIVAQVMEFVTK